MPFASRFSDRNVLLSFHLLNHAVLHAIQFSFIFAFVQRVNYFISFKKMYDTIRCTGKETYLQNCNWTERSKRKYPCKHYSDAGVKCNVPKRRQQNKMKVRIERTVFN